MGLAPVVVASPAVAAPASRPVALTMVLPTDDSKTMEAKDVTKYGKGKGDWQLYIGGQPDYRDPWQSDLLQGCALASILGAQAYTQAGRRRITAMIQSVPAAVRVDLTALKNAQSEWKETEMTADRLFNVTLGASGAKGGNVVQVSGVFYSDDSLGLNMIYMRSRRNAYWPCLIEKAYAKHLGGSYSVFTKLVDPRVVWSDVVGQAPEVLRLPATAAKVLEFVDRAKARATIAASKSLDVAQYVTPDHGFVVLGRGKGPGKRGRRKDEGPPIDLFDPLSQVRFALPLSHFMGDFVLMCQQGA